VVRNWPYALYVAKIAIIKCFCGSDELQIPTWVAVMAAVSVCAGILCVAAFAFHWMYNKTATFAGA
jgi:hypothetical protein